ncbi:MAG: phosphatidate cytidylyltransferase [Gaiellaceae bacterium]
MSPLVSRVVVGGALLPVVLYVVWLGGWWLFGLALVGGLVALHELYSMSRSLRPLVLGGYAGLVFALIGAELGSAPWLVAGVVGTFLFAFLVFGVSDARPSFTASMGTTLLGVVWVAGGLALLIILRDVPQHGRLAVLTVLLAVWADDSAAYFVGRLLGRHRMAPTISPGKTWEGFVAGALTAIAVCFFALYKQHFLSSLEAVALGAAVAVSAALGDLFESAVKRDLGVKDSGRILGGHGGMLDRIDAQLFAVPAAFVIVLAFGQA